ncbi:MAG: hypothetical protein A3G93_13960 [Nitrospinae bacterium RIFCSPLOWO2_12_FULL_45_22]|nr:MAG: hypothetical protein A3G93_13960 [Nitrospinae bacterium RIFCSPLOWO2_12_FULL_45_22]
MSFLITFIHLYVFWILLSGHFDIFHLSLGVICCALVAYGTHDLVLEGLPIDMHTEVIRFIKYLPWLVYQIILANIHVAYLALSPKMPIEPRIIKIKTKLKRDLALVTFANSITLTPGTITVDIKEGVYDVHALSEKVSEDLLSGEMENRVAHIFMED